MPAVAFTYANARVPLLAELDDRDANTLREYLQLAKVESSMAGWKLGERIGKALQHESAQTLAIDSDERDAIHFVCSEPAVTQQYPGLLPLCEAVANL